MTCEDNIKIPNSVPITSALLMHCLWLLWHSHSIAEELLQTLYGPPSLKCTQALYRKCLPTQSKERRGFFGMSMVHMEWTC